MKNVKVIKNHMMEIYALGLALAVVGMAIIFQCVYYYQPDDYLMNYICGGIFGNGYDSYLIFINIVLGKVISFLYNFIPNINWFAITYLIAIIVIFYSLFYLFLKSGKNHFMLVIIAIMEWIMMSILTFTVIAYMAMGTFFVYALHLICTEEENNLRQKYILASILLALGFCFRIGWNVFLSTMVLILPVGILKLKKIRKKEIKKILLIVIIEFIVLQGCNWATYNTDEFWNDYQTYNAARSEVLDKPSVDYVTKETELKKMQISKNDLECINSWIFADKEVYSVERLQELGKVNSLKEKRELNILSITQNMIKNKFNYVYAAIALAFLISSKKKSRIGILGVSGSVYFLIAILYFLNRAVERVMVPIYIIAVLVMLYIRVSEQDEQRLCKNKVFRAYVGLLLICTMAFWAKKNYSNYHWQKWSEARFAQVWEYIEDNKNCLFVGSSATINPMLINHTMFEAGDALLVGNLMKLGSWDIYSTRYYSQVEKFDLTEKERVLISMIYDDNVIYIVDDDSIQQKDMIEKYLEEHTGNQVETVLLERFEDSRISLYQFKEKI